jgi:hypothetical protein
MRIFTRPGLHYGSFVNSAPTLSVAGIEAPNISVTVEGSKFMLSTG